MKIASIVLFVLLIASLVSLVLTSNALKSTKAQLARVQAQLADEVAHSTALQHALQAERVANNEYLEKTKKADDTRDAFMRVASVLDVVPIDDGVRKSAIDAYKSLICADSVPCGTCAHLKLAKVYEGRACTRTSATRGRSRPFNRTATRIASGESSQR